MVWRANQSFPFLRVLTASFGRGRLPGLRSLLAPAKTEPTSPAGFAVVQFVALVKRADVRANLKEANTNC